MSHLAKVLRALICGAAPERASEIAILWDRYRPDIHIVPDGAGVIMNANRHRIQFDFKTLDALWLIGFSGWRALETYAPHVLIATDNQQSIENIIRADGELGPFELDYKHRLRLAQDLIASDGTTAVMWPPDIPRPTADRDSLNGVEVQVAFDLTCMAVAYVFLHELRHVMFDRDGHRPAVPAEEELACDVWARGMLLDKLAVYASKHGHKYDELLNKRAIAMALASLILHMITPDHARWGNNDYPPVGERVAALVKDVPLRSSAAFWVFTASVLIGVARESHQVIDIIPDSASQLVDLLIGRLR